MHYPTIAAISTPVGPGGIGIVRISGPAAYSILRRVFKPKNNHREGRPGEALEQPFLSHRVYYGFLIDPVSGTPIDEVLAIYMKGPKSFTREDVVEVQSHSGYVLLNRILGILIDNGASLADPGDFTKRAFLNGRIDLTQAEAVIDLINAPSETAAQLACQQVAGGIKDAVAELVDALTALQAGCEAQIEFFEEIRSDNGLTALSTKIDESILPTIDGLIQREKDAAIYRDGIKLAILGLPNVGKSSLLNVLVERDAAIVSSLPGTTRDIIREHISINGIPVVACDTAGIQESADPVERIGIQKAKDQLVGADIVLMVLDGSRALQPGDERLVDEARAFNTILVINKDDVAIESVLSFVRQRFSELSQIRISAATRSGIERLKEMIFRRLVNGNRHGFSDWVSPNRRQRQILEQAREELNRLIESCHHHQDVEQVSGRLAQVCRRLEEISGNRGNADLYDYIFSQFCVGK